MSNYFLFVVDIPSPGISSKTTNEPSKWFDFENKANAILLPEEAKKLYCKNVWLFASEGSEQARRALANYAYEHQLNHSSFLISGEISQI